MADTPKLDAPAASQAASDIETHPSPDAVDLRRDLFDVIRALDSLRNDTNRDLSDLKEAFKQSDHSLDRDIDDVQRDIRALADNLKTTEVLGKLGETTSRVGSVNASVQALDQSVKRVDAKTPPLAQWIAAIIIVVGLLGANVFQSMGLRDTIDTTAQAATDVTSQIAEASAQIDHLVDQVETERNAHLQRLAELESNIDALKLAVDAFPDEVTSVTNALVARLEGASQQMTEEVKQFQRDAIKFAGQTGHSPLSEEGGVGSILEDLAGLTDGLPRSFRLSAQATAAIERGNYDQALVLAEQGLQSADSDEQRIVFYVIQARALRRKPDGLDSAIDVLQEALAIDPEDDVLLNNIGSLYYSRAIQDGASDAQGQSDLQKSAEFLLRAIEADALDPVSVANLAITYNAMGLSAQAMDVLDSFDGPNSPEINHVRAATLALLGQKDEAIQIIDDLVTTDRKMALMIMADDDLASLRNDERFLKIMRDALGEQMLQAAIQVWEGEP